MAYRKIDHQKLWKSSTYRSMSRDARDLYLYLLTSPHNNPLCCYWLPLGYAAGDLQWKVEAVQKAMDELVSTTRADGTSMVYRDKETDLVAVHGQLEKEGISNPNTVTACLTTLNQLPTTSPVYAHILDTCERLGKPFIQRLIKQLRQRIPELQEQEQEQEQEKSVGATPKGDAPVPLEKLMEPYPEGGRQLIIQVFDALASTRKTGVIAQSVLRAQLLKWNAYPVPQVIGGIKTYLDKGYHEDGKKEAYLLGVIRNWRKGDAPTQGAKHGETDPIEELYDDA